MKKLVVSAVCVMFLLGPVYAADPGPEPALDGNCPVCLVKMSKLVEGDPDISSFYDGRKYLFPSAEQKRMFDANPTAFVPALGGDCTVCKIEKGKKVAGNSRFYSIHDGRLYLFPSSKQKRRFDKSPEKYADADLALDGNCPVCLVKNDKLVRGQPEYVSVYDGRRYLFPGPKQKRIFDADPAAFAPAMRGNCTVCRVEMGKDVRGSAGFHLVHNGRLYLFPSAKQKQMFQSDPTWYADADLALEGYCAVCKVELNEDLKGLSEFATDYNGKRYLFIGKKQLEMFQGDPAKYAVE
ncbi:MAG: hypothetical protein ACYTFA_11765 [Planctomycetota bacterium]